MNEGGEVGVVVAEFLGDDFDGASEELGGGFEALGGDVEFGEGSVPRRCSHRPDRSGFRQY